MEEETRFETRQVIAICIAMVIIVVTALAVIYGTNAEADRKDVRQTEIRVQACEKMEDLHLRTICLLRERED